nr:ATP-binding protein [Methylobacterium sp. ZNC0032]
MTAQAERSPLASPPTPRQNLLAGGLIALLIGVLVVTIPYTRQPTIGTEPFVAAYAAAIFIIEMTAAALLFAQFAVQRSRAILLLAAGFLFSALLAIPWALTFPGVFTALAPEPNLQATATIAALRRLSFPLFVIAYALLGRRPWPGATARVLVGTIFGTLIAALACSLLIVTNAAKLPPFMADARSVARLWTYVPAAAIVLYLAGLAALAARRRTTLDLWLMVLLVTLLSEIILISYFGAAVRLSVGWWAGRIYGLISAGVVLLVLLSEATTVHARLARAEIAERRARQNRLTAIEALSASIAHEVNQPLASMVTNASAGLRWLDRERPEIVEIRAALERIVADGHRANRIVAGIRAMFVQPTQERAPLDLNRMVAATLRQLAGDVRLARVEVKTTFEDALPAVIGNALQIEQVLCNLIDNAVDAMCATPGQRLLLLSSRRQPYGEVLVAIADNGSGLAEAERDRIFEPFFTTKPNGMGMGLMFCRTVIEAHGGRLWASDNRPRGAVFQFTLPAAAGLRTDGSPSP